MEKRPVNYDFGKNWKTQIVPHLSNLRLKRAIKRGIDRFCGEGTYKRRTAPAEHSAYDTYCTLCDRLDEIELDRLEDIGKLPRKYNRQKILKRFHSWNNIKNNLETYVVWHRCHSWAPTFQLTLAQLVEPEEQWKIRTGDDHTTVINEAETKVFDILYWSCDYIYNYLFGDSLEEEVKNDTTLGGYKAYRDSA